MRLINNDFYSRFSTGFQLLSLPDSDIILHIILSEAMQIFVCIQILKCIMMSTIFTGQIISTILTLLQLLFIVFICSFQKRHAAPLKRSEGNKEISQEL